VFRLVNVLLIAATLDVVPSRDASALSAVDVLGLGEQPLSINAAMHHAACRLRILRVFMAPPRPEDRGFRMGRTCGVRPMAA